MKVLIGVDGSPSSDAALNVASQLLAEDKDAAVLYYSPPRVDLQKWPASDADAEQDARDWLAASVFGHASSQLPEPIAKRCETIVGAQKPAHGILAAANFLRPDLIAVGARGTNPFARLLMGSVSRSVVHQAGIPVLIARAAERPTAEPLRVLLACDHSHGQEQIGAFLNRLTWPAGTFVVAVHVIESLFSGQLPEWLKQKARQSTDEPLAQLWVEEEQREKDEWIASMKDYCAGLPDAFQKNDPVVLEGHPAEQIVQYANDERIDLIILGARVLGPMARFFAGSTSEHVLSHSTCSVLVIPHHERP